MNERAVFDEALNIADPNERAAFLDRACGDETEVRRKVEQMLGVQEKLGGFLEHPAVLGISTEPLADGTDAFDKNAGVSRTMPHVDDIPLDFLDPPQKPGALGRLGQYDVLEVVGRGGMGVVLKAQDTRLNRVVAVKVLAPELASNPTARKRFSREAQAAAAVSHDHVVTIYAVEDGGNPERNPVFSKNRVSEWLPYLVMEFIDGQSLEEKIDHEGPLELKEILRIGRQAAAGLAAAHAQGLIHRDVKPSNILLQNGVQRVQITDFGLARAVDDVGTTRTGEVTGTPQYMSPEQAQGQRVDARSDLFSLGSVLYAMCTGRSPFRADTSVASLRRVCDDTPRPIREINPDIPDWLVTIIDRLLEKNADDRFQTADEVAELLGRHLAHVQDPASTPFPGTVRPLQRENPSRAPRRGQRWVVAGLALFVLAVGFGTTEATGVTNLEETLATVVRIVTGEGTLLIEVNDPEMLVTLDGEELSISGAGLQELKLRPGQYQFRATKDGEPVSQELVTIERGGRRLLRISGEETPVAAPAPAPTSEQADGQTAEEVLAIGHQFAEQGDWTAAIAAFEKWESLPYDQKDLRQGPGQYLLLLFLLSDNQARFRSQLAHHFSYPHGNDDAAVAVWSKWIVLSQLCFQPVEPPAEAIDWLLEIHETLTVGSPPKTVERGSWWDNHAMLAVKLFEYRQGHFQEVIEFPTWNDDWFSHYQVVDLFFQSMAYAQLDDAENARRCYEEAVRMQDSNVPPRGATVYDERRHKPLWYRWGLYDIAHAQAEEVLTERGILSDRP